MAFRQTCFPWQSVCCIRYETWWSCHLVFEWLYLPPASETSLSQSNMSKSSWGDFKWGTMEIFSGTFSGTFATFSTRGCSRKLRRIVRNSGSWHWRNRVWYPVEFYSDVGVPAEKWGKTWTPPWAFYFETINIDCPETNTAIISFNIRVVMPYWQMIGVSRHVEPLSWLSNRESMLTGSFS